MSANGTWDKLKTQMVSFILGCNVFYLNLNFGFNGHEGLYGLCSPNTIAQTLVPDFFIQCNVAAPGVLGVILRSGRKQRQAVHIFIHTSHAQVPNA